MAIPIARSAEPTLSYLGGASLGKLLGAQKRATEMALSASKRPCMTIRLPTINAYTVGQFIYLMECATVIAAKLFGVNPYDQPAVEVGKKITYHVLGRAGYGNLSKIMKSEG